VYPLAGLIGNIILLMKSISEHGTDVGALQDHLGQPLLRYLDFQSRENGRRALDQWPLLGKLRLSGIRDRESGVVTGPPPDSSA
jgi:hypothetical protein